MQSLPSPFYRGKVRDLYPVDDSTMVMVAADRVSAFDVVFNETIKGKGILLTEISNAWFYALAKSGFLQSRSLDAHLIETEIEKFPAPYNAHEELSGRAIYVRKVKRIDFECVVRGYLAGSAWKEYAATQSVCGMALPAGLKQASLLPEPIFTPATKAPDGEHDQNVSLEFMKSKIGAELTDRLATLSIDIFRFASELLQKEGILLCDTKFEFGLDGDRVVLIDEVLTPDSSRMWSENDYREGETPPGFDKQHIRDYVESIGWDKTPPAPPLPDDVCAKTVELYSEIHRRIFKVLHF